MRRLQMILFFVFGIPCFLNAFASPNAEATEGFTITVKINGMKNTTGMVRVSLFNSEENFLAQTYKELASEIEDQNEVIVMFLDIPTGSYAINVFHDENNNQELDTNFFRIPKEPYGFSNNVRGKMGPPEYEDVKFKVDDSNIVLQISMK